MKKYQLIWAVTMMLATAASGARGDEERVVATLEKVGAEVTRDKNQPGQPVVEVLLGTYQVRDVDLGELAALMHLRSLAINDCRVTDAGLKGLARLTQLRSLSLQSCIMVTDAGLKELAGLKSLQSLDLSGTQVTDAGLKELTALKQLQKLSLFRTSVTDQGVAELQRALPECGINR